LGDWLEPPEFELPGFRDVLSRSHSVPGAAITESILSLASIVVGCFEADAVQAGLR
jgi:hypothetical protein